jgi:hypothetical protein
MQKFIPLTGTANMAAGVLLLAFWYLYALLLPYRQLNDTLAILVNQKHWVFVNILGVTGSIFGLLGLVGIFIKGVERSNTLGTAGFILAFFGTVLFTATLVWDTILWPILSAYDAEILSFQGPIYTSKTFVPFFIFIGILIALGYVLLGISLAQSGVFPYWGTLMITVGAPLFGMGSMFGKYQVYPRTVGISLLCIGLIWLGNIMRSS